VEGQNAALHSFFASHLYNMQFYSKEFRLLAATRVTCSLSGLPLRRGKKIPELCNTVQ
jgi:hypothetical protein